MTNLKKRVMKSLYENHLNQEEMKDAGAVYNTQEFCGCACKYVNSGGSLIETNGHTNYTHGYYSPTQTWKYYEYDTDEGHFVFVE